MQEPHINKDHSIPDDETSFLELIYTLWYGKWIIFSVTAFASILGVIYSLSLPNVYTSKALLVPVNSSNSISGALGSLGGLAGLAGVNLSAGGDESNSAKALEKITSLSFFENNILTNISLPDLMAVKSWDSKKNILVFDESIYNSESSTWVKDDSNKDQTPSAQKSYRVFIQHISVGQDIKSGFVTLAVKHQSPFIAKQWAELVINEVNAFYREKDKLESEKAVRYLNQQIEMTRLSEVRQVLAQLLQEEIKKLSLIEADKFFVFDYIDPPAVMERKSAPKRAVICILSALLGGMLSILLVLIRHYYRIYNLKTES